MVERYFNPFQGIDVSIPTEFHDDLARYSEREGKAKYDQSPFPRMVDMWFLAVCIAARENLMPADLGKRKMTKIIDGAIFGSDPWRIHALMLIAMARTGVVEIVADPRKMLTLANGLAVAGFPRVLEMLREGKGDPIYNLSDAVEEMVGE